LGTVYDVGIMSGDEQDAAIIRIVRRRKELRVRKALIESELQMAGDSLNDIGAALRHISGSFPEHIASIKVQLQKAPEICELDRIKGMVAELGQIYAEFTQLNRSAAEAGID
jgi:hypothetical protein